MKRLTRQEWFDNAWNHFVVNKGEPSHNHQECRYRGPNGAKCAIGVSIPDDLYESDFKLYEGCGIGDLVDEEFIFQEDLKFLTDLQRCHDDSSFQRENDLILDNVVNFHSEIKSKLTNLAKNYTLQLRLS